MAWRWGAEQQHAFDKLKAALCSPPVLLVPDQSKPFVLNCDACKYAIGATLQQDHGSGLQPVAYFSAKMTDAERNYDVREQEFMALLRACLHWRHYLHGTQPFTLLTDHDSLKYHKSMPNLSGRLARWVEKMAEFDYQLAAHPGQGQRGGGRAQQARGPRGERGPVARPHRHRQGQHAWRSPRTTASRRWPQCAHRVRRSRLSNASATSTPPRKCCRASTTRRSRTARARS